MSPFMQVLIPLSKDILLAVLLLAVLTIDLFTGPEQRRRVGIFTALGLIGILVADIVIGLTFVGHPAFEGPVLGGMIRYDMLSLIFRSMILLTAALTCLISLDVPDLGRSGEYYIILLVATLGMVLMTSSADLIMLFVALETTSISLYVLAGYLRNNRRSTEAGIKYYLFGAFTSGILLYGLSLLYGFTGSTSLYTLAGPLGELFASGAEGQFALIVALLLVLAGFGFKISAVPFHFWTPDVYEGAPSPVTAFVSTASKAASFALLVRIFVAVWPTDSMLFWTSLVAAMSVITMTLGNVLALVQTNLKRLLAYSSIAQAGYTLIGVVALGTSPLGVASVAFYMFMYVLTNLLAFAVIITVSNQTGTDEIADFASLGKRSPYLALVMVLALLSLSGVPPAAGFFGKFMLFAAAVDAGYVWLAVVGVLNSIIGLYYYLTVIKIMYVDPNEDTRPIPTSAAYRIAMFLSAVGVLVLGIVPAFLWDWALGAAQALVAVVP